MKEFDLNETLCILSVIEDASTSRIPWFLRGFLLFLLFHLPIDLLFLYFLFWNLIIRNCLTNPVFFLTTNELLLCSLLPWFVFGKIKSLLHSITFSKFPIFSSLSSVQLCRLVIDGVDDILIRQNFFYRVKFLRERVDEESVQSPIRAIL